MHKSSNLNRLSPRNRHRRPTAAAATRHPLRRAVLETLETRSLMTCATISGFAYHDFNNNGLRDYGEAAIANTSITLRNSAGLVVGQTTTDANGFYQFEDDATISTAEQTIAYDYNIANQTTDWTIQKSVPLFDPSLGTLLSVEVRQAGNITSTIAVENMSTLSGRTLSGSVSGTVSISGSGFNLPVSPVANTSTFAATKYDGKDDFAGTSGITFPTLIASASTSTSLTDPAVLASYTGTGTGTGTVTITQSAVAVSQVLGGGNLHTNIATTAGASFSIIYHYLPNNCLKPDTYTITETQPAGYLDGQETAGNVTPIPNSAGGPDSIPVTVLPGVSDYPNNNFGELLPASIGNRVWFDLNQNGVQDASESGMPDVLVTLSNGATTTTDADGYYRFDDLVPGDYSVTFTAPDGFSFTTTNAAAANDATDSDADVTTGATGIYSLSSGQYDDSVDAGLVPVTLPGPVVSSLSGFVYYDSNNDGSRSNEAPIGGAFVTLTGTDYLNNPVSLSTTTANDGSYSFTNLLPGTYTLTETQPANYLDGKDTIGTPGGTTANDQFSAINLPAGTDGVENNFGELLPASLGDRVWVDANRDGVQDAGEAGLPNVAVTLYDANGNALGTTTTDSTGIYAFNGLLPGTYSVGFTLPAGYVFTAKDAAAATDATDSDADSVTGLTASTTLAAGQADLTLDAGLYALTPAVDIEKYVNPEATPVGGEGLTPGFWKQSQHFDAWTNFHTTDSYNAVFGVNDPAGSSLTLLDALARGGGANKALGRHAVAALLNAANPNVSYLYTAGQIIALVQNAYATGDFDSAKNLLAQQNELEADLSTPATFNPTAPGYGYDADTVGSGPTVLPGTQLTFTFVVRNTGETPLLNVVVTDDNATPADPLDDFAPTYVSGDTNHDSILDLNETWVYTYVTNALAGSYTNTASVTGTNVFNSSQQVTDADAANYSTGDVTQPPPPPAPASISGLVYWDKDNDGTIDADESGIAGVTVLLTGTDDDGNAVSLTDTTAADGSYSFENLRPGTYSVHETQPAGYDDGIDSVGSLGGTTSNDLFSAITIDAGDSGVNYNFGERKSTPPSTTPTLSTGMTATIGFWQNKNGQALIKSMNGGPSSTNLGNWFATSFPNLFGPDAGANDLSGKTNSFVANRFTTLFKQKGMKLQAQVMAVGFAIYVTDTSLAGGNYAASYGFVTNSTGTGAATYNVGAAGDSLGLSDNQTYTVLQIIQAANSSDLFSTSTSTQTAANSIFDGINNTGDIT